jgi:hypothetical protein
VLTLSNLVEHLPDEISGELLNAVPSVVDEWLRAGLLNSLAGRLRAESIDRAIAFARDLIDPAPRVDALSSLAHPLPGEAKIDLLREAYTSAAQIEDDSARAETLTALIGQLPDEMKDAATREALAAARATVDPEMRAMLLTDLLDYAEEKPGFSVDEALSAARQIEKAASRAAALSALIGHLSPDQRQIIINETLGLMV